MAWRIGGKVRALRKRRGWRQQDLAGRLGWSRELISRIENDRLDNVPFGKVQACINALGGFLRTDVLWHGEQLHRLMDARHAAIQNALVRLVESLGWTSRVEVSFNHYGDRGRIDVMAWHPRTGSLAVVEVESVLGDVQDTLGRLDVKVRLAREIAGGIGWTVSSVVPVLVLAEGTTQRRHVAEHGALFGGFEVRGRSAMAWLRHPRGTSPRGLLLFLRLPDSRVSDARPRSRR